MYHRVVTLKQIMIREPVLLHEGERAGLQLIVCLLYTHTSYSSCLYNSVFILAMAYDLEDYSECGRCPSCSVLKEHRSAEKCFGNWVGFRSSLFLLGTLDQVLFHLFTCGRKEIQF